MPTSSNSSFSKRARSYSRPQTPTSIQSRYASSPARSSKPKLLPFPDLPIRGVSRDASRATSPSETPLHLSPEGSLNSSAIGISSIALEASGSGSGSGYFGSVEEVGSATGTASGQRSASGTGNNTPSGATTPRSPLGRPSISVSHPHVSITGSSVANRLRSQTTSDVMHHSRPSRAVASGSASTSVSPTQPPRLASPQSILLNPIISSANPTTRIEGFHPTPVSPTATIRASSVPTHINSSAAATSVPAATPSSFVVPPTPIQKDSPLIPKSAPPNTTGALSAALSPSAMPDALGDHLYRSFLTGSCADVRIWVRKWGVGWAVHRMVLVQASFFHSMFLGGFSETGARKSRKGKEKALFVDDNDWMGEDLEIQFDDPNITRAAFEVCLSRLYSPFPQLQFPVALIPTPFHPLSPCFTGDIDISYPDIISTLPPRTQLATPRLLLSLLATTIYLGHSALLREVLSLILRTIGPETIGRYLSFAVGDGIGEEEWDGQTEEGAIGLEDVAKSLLPNVRAHSNESSPRKRRSARSSTDSAISNAKSDDEELKCEGPGHGSSRQKSKPSPLSFEPNSPLDSHETEDESDESALPHFYGFASDKIGEACCCFLTRWGAEILDQETRFDQDEPLWRVFARGGIHAKFLRALLSSDTLFVDNEMDRYRAARKVLDLRRRGKEDEGDLGMSHLSIAGDSEDDNDDWEDEEELEKVFTDGIYYTHMTFEDLSTIAADIDPHTGLPFAPLHVLQAAHWSAADLKSRILNAASGNRESEAALGLCKFAHDLSQVGQRRRRPRTSRNTTPSSDYSSSFSIGPSASTSSAFSSNSTGSTNALYYPVSSDDTYRIGAAGLLFTNTHLTAAAPILGILGMPDLGPAATSDFFEDTQDPEEKPKPRPPPHDERTYFGLSRQCRLLSDITSTTNIHANPKGKWSKAEPFRFCVEFWNCHLLAERERMYSTTHFYAGSWFNVYVQTIRKKDKGIQLGIYLHRQHPGEPFPAHSTPDSVVGLPTSPQSPPSGLRGGAPLGRSMTGQVTVGSPRADGGYQALSDELKRKEPYRDDRPLTMAYFSITCASALGTALLRFSSAPDSFTNSQSWGWKSSALRSEEYLSGSHVVDNETLEDGVLGYTAGMPRGGSLRASVIVGIV